MGAVKRAALLFSLVLLSSLFALFLWFHLLPALWNNGICGKEASSPRIRNPFCPEALVVRHLLWIKLHLVNGSLGRLKLERFRRRSERGLMDAFVSFVLPGGIDDCSAKALCCFQCVQLCMFLSQTRFLSILSLSLSRCLEKYGTCHC